MEVSSAGCCRTAVSVSYTHLDVYKRQRPVILVEGILLLADPRIRDLLDIKVYVEADADERLSLIHI